MDNGMSAGMAAVLIGMAAGFVALIGLYLSFGGGDATTGIALLAMAPCLLALLPTVTRRRRPGADCAKR